MLMIPPIQRRMALLFLFAASTVQHAEAQHFDKLTRSVATVQDTVLIGTLLQDLLIPASHVERIDVIDLTANGYGPDDVILLHPSLEAYLVGADVPRGVQDVMKTWELEEDYRLDATLEDSDRVERDAHQRQNARDALSGAVLGAINRYYTGDEIDLRLSRETSGLRLEMWNYDPAALRYAVPSQGPVCLATASQKGMEQQFRFSKPYIVLSFRDAGDCVVSSLQEGKVHTRPCTP